jgi:ornithine cyclodeaminase/alanine dehydrogenase-like protein (mu-crystallin family)
MPLLLTEQDVTELLDMEVAVQAVEAVLRNQAEGRATNRPRQRVASPSCQMHVMPAGDRALGVCGLKTYTASKKGSRFLVLLYDFENGDLLAIIEADRLGQMRTGAASGVAVKYMSRSDADTAGIFGSGWQAESQLRALCAVRQIKSIRVYSRSAERREAFARRMTALLRVDVSPVETAREAAENQSIVITATTAREPVLKGEWISAGSHLNIMGSNFLAKCEVDVETIRRASIIAVDSVEQSKIEAGDLLPAIERGVIFWESVNELGRIVAGQVPGRRTGEEITMFKSNGIALWDIAVAKVVYERALERKAGEYRPMWENR